MAQFQSPTNQAHHVSAPYTVRYSPQLPELLSQLNISLAISTYQAGKVIFLSPKGNESLIQLPRNFNQAMGIGLDKHKMVIATKDEVISLRNSLELARSYPQKPDTYDALFIPRTTYYTGQIDIHDIDFGVDGIYAVNTSFSCVVKIDGEFSFTPVWTPPFISNLVSEDRCHLNGMALENGLPKYVTALGRGNSFQSWRDHIASGGVIMDVDSSEVITQNVPMPHSPRIWNGELFVLHTATGELVCVDKNTGQHQVVFKQDGFLRGMDRYDDYAFIGMSKLRKNSSAFSQLEISRKSNRAGVVVVHIPTGVAVGEIVYENSVDEIYDVKVLEGVTRPNILNTMRDDHKLALQTPGHTFWAQPNQNQ
ncbi:MAG: TIGR03032 family protein [Flavobacteriales bacterium]|nr:TIGR03032 family protein [Flavobacteriales bacterium]